ncbi:metallophosphoesterase family protein [Aureimonas psammosilenae]|uniref:metallophosphoesterase family protein n=1 Tax=Aureimonas psammosilenae TaxID=2495496 RepID=UPI0012613072|nr:DNA repair exonuclease [Aureimonas psammosilenae]
MAFRFVHTADLHLDSPLRSLSLRNPELAGLIGGATRAALTAIVDLCIEERVDALLIAGDLYDGDQTSMKTARFLGAEMARLADAGIAVFKIRGNHDATSRITARLGLPDNVKVFGEKAETVTVSTGVDVVLHGISFAKPQAPESLLPRFAAPVPDAVNIGLLHTSLGGTAGHDVYAPCSLAELSARGFRYWALGHIHKRDAYADGPATVVMPGIPQGRDINEAGAKSVTLVTVSDDGSVQAQERITSVAEFGRVTVDLSGIASWREAREAMEAALGRAREKARSPHLVARLHLTGATPLAFRLRRDRDVLAEEIEAFAVGFGTLWIDKLVVEAGEPVEEGAPASGDPLSELSRLMRGEIRAAHGLRHEIEGLARELLNDLPAEARGFSGADDAEFSEFLTRVIGEGSEEVLARLAAVEGEDA